MKLQTKLSNPSKDYQNQRRNISTRGNIDGFQPSFYKPASSHKGMAELQFCLMSREPKRASPQDDFHSQRHKVCHLHFAETQGPHQGRAS